MRKTAMLLTVAIFIACFACGCFVRPPLWLHAEPSPAPTMSPAPVYTPVPISLDDRAGVRFSDMTYTRPDTDALRAAIDELERNIDDGQDAAGLVAAYEDIYAQFSAAESAMSLAYLLYAFDVTATHYENEYVFLQSELNAIDLMMTDVSVRLFASSDEAARLVEEKFGEAYMETVYDEETLNSEEIQDLQQQEVQLINEYNRVSTAFVLTDNGKEYTIDDILEIEDFDELYTLYDKYASALNASVGEIFLRMLDVRASIAEKLGYGSYAAYMYDCYGRDYTLQDAARLQQAVKKHIVPVYRDALGGGAAEAYAVADGESAISDILDALKGIVAAFSEEMDDREYDAYLLSVETFPFEPYIETLQGATADFSPKLYAPLQYMLRYDLYDFSVDPNKMAGSFATYISEYDAPFIFSQWDNSAECVGTVIHELGHFTNYYRNATVGWSMGDSLDLAEVDSQGLELLMLPYYDRFYGDLAAAAERELLIDCMYALISGCMEDELQQAIYADPGMSLAEINEAYRKLADEYGFVELYGYTGTEWAQVPHTFQSPMYYISYAVSMVPALELWKLSQADADAAKTAYFKIVDRAPYASFQQTLAENDLTDVFAESTVKGIASLLAQRVR